MRRLVGPEPESCGAVAEFGDLRVLVRLAGLAADRRDDPVGVVDHPTLHPLENLAAALESERFPARLGGPPAPRQFGDVLATHVGYLPDHLAGGGILDRDLCPPLLAV